MSTIRISWVLPTTRTSGRELKVEDIAHVEIQVSTDMGANYVVLDEIAPPETSTDVTEAEPGLWKFQAVVVDVDGRRSAAKNGEILVPDTSNPGEVLELHINLV